MEYQHPGLNVKKQEIKEADINEIIHTIKVVKLNYEVWCDLKDKKIRDNYVDILHRHNIYFGTAINAHAVASIVQMERIFQKGRTYNTIPNLLKKLCENDTFDLNEIKEFETKVEPIRIKLSDLRSKVIAHSLSISESKKAVKQPTVEEFKDLLDSTIEIMNKITHSIYNYTNAFNLSNQGTVRKLFEELKGNLSYKNRK